LIDLGSIVHSGDGIVSGQACAEPQTLMEALVAQRAALPGCRLFLGASYSGIVRPEHADVLRLSSYGGIGTNRALADAGKLELLKVPYSRLAPMIRAGEIRSDVVCIQVSPPNARGEYSLGLAADYLIAALDVCRAVVAEVNDRIPWTRTEVALKRDDLDLLIESSRPPAAPRARPSGALEQAIAAHAAARFRMQCVLHSRKNGT
jgi:acetyl-CoA hydrolase